MKRIVRKVVENCPIELANLYWLLASKRWETAAIRTQRSFEQRVFEQLGCPSRVISGPFSEMVYNVPSGCGAWLPRLLGTYEQELTSAVQNLIDDAGDCLVDVGAAEGYYAVGFAKRCADTRIVAYETEPYYRHLMRRLQKVNCIKNLSIHSTCTVDKLHEFSSGLRKWSLICDVEGFEDELLSLEKVPSLKNAKILVETHDVLCPGVCKRITERFLISHRIVSIKSSVRTLDDWNYTDNILQSDRLQALNEHRSTQQEWLFMTPLSSE